MVQARRVHAPQVGFNNNVRHKGRVFHIQTEDSGTAYARITTHLFADGGRILRSQRTEYGELLGSEELPELLRRRMKEQHRDMFTALREGRLDELIAALDDPDGARSGADAVAPPVPPPHGRPTLGNTSIGPLPSTGDSGSMLAGEERASATRMSETAASSKPAASNHGSGGHRPAVSAGESRPGKAEPRSIFGSASISEQSLDDVILSYISEDLDGE
jgi:hypothetical protein